MSFDWGEFYWAADVFNTLAQSRPEGQKAAALFRSAISRAYYGAYKESESLHVAKMGPVRKGKSEGVHAQFFSSLNFKASRVKDQNIRSEIFGLEQDLKQLHKFRIDADYGDDNGVVLQNVATALVYAGRVQSRVKKLGETITPAMFL